MDMDLIESDTQSAKAAEGLPRLYELVSTEQVDSAVDEAVRRAEAGAAEGTLVHARSQTAAAGRCGQDWLSPAGGLYAGLVLRPDEIPADAVQLGVVGVVALGSAVAEHVLPLTELHFRWPNDLLLRHGKVASIQMRWSAAESGRTEWLVLGINANVSAPPSLLGHDAASVQVDGECAVSAGQLLNSFARQFLIWVDRWANDGFEPVRKVWQQRMVGIGDDYAVSVAGSLREGRIVNIGADGGLLLGHGDAIDRISLTDAFARTEPESGS